MLLPNDYDKRREAYLQAMRQFLSVQQEYMTYYKPRTPDDTFCNDINCNGRTRDYYYEGRKLKICTMCLKAYWAN